MNDHPKRATDDVRMRGFADRHTVDAALAWLDPQLQPAGTEIVPLQVAGGRVAAAPVVSEVDVPGFDRATMDGYAVVADSTEGATSYNRLPLIVSGEALPGRPFRGSVVAGQAVRIMTGAPMPPGCDAVLPAEWVEHASPTPVAAIDVMSRNPEAIVARSISALAAVSPGKH